MAAELFPYDRPQHDPQKLMRASLASSCLRGALSVWRFQEGMAGKDIRALAEQDSLNARATFVRTGTLHQLAALPALRMHTMMCRALGRAWEYHWVCKALEHGQVEMWEWLLRPGTDPVRDRLMDSVLQVDWSPESRTKFETPLLVLLRFACERNWAWAIRRLEHIVDETEEPVIAVARESGVLPVVMAMSCARVRPEPHHGGPASTLAWVKHFFAKTPPDSEIHWYPLDEDLGLQVLHSCPLSVAEWMSAQGLLLSSGVLSEPQHIASAARGANWQVMEWLITRGHEPLKERRGQSAEHLPDYSGRRGVCPIDDAAHHDNCDWALDFLRDAHLGRVSYRAAHNAARRGCITTLRWLEADVNSHMPCHWTVMEDTVDGGYLSAVEFFAHGKVTDERTWWTTRCLTNAARGGHLEILEWARRQGFLRRLQQEAPQPLHLYAARPNVVPFLVKHMPRVRWDVSVMAVACSDSSTLGAVSALHARQPNLLAQPPVLRAAACAGAMAAMEFILENVPAGCLSAPPDLHLAACARNRVQAVEFLHKRVPLPIPVTALDTAAVHDALEMVEYLHYRERLRPSASTASIVAMNGSLRVLHFLLDHCGCRLPTDPETLAQVVIRGHLPVLEFILASEPSCATRSLLNANLKREGDPPVYRSWAVQQYLQRTVGAIVVGDDSGT